jgi:hypothetical protein
MAKKKAAKITKKSPEKVVKSLYGTDRNAVIPQEILRESDNALKAERLKVIDVEVEVEVEEVEAKAPEAATPPEPKVVDVHPGWADSTRQSEDFVNRLDFAVGGQFHADPTAIPEYVTSYTGEKRRIRSDGIAYRWASFERIEERKRMGYRFVMYDDLFRDTGHFERDIHGRVVNGDVVLMYIGKEQLAKIGAEYERRRKLMEDGVQDSFHEEAHKIARQADIHNFYTTKGGKDGEREERIE